MSLFDAAHTFHLHMMAIVEQYKINTGEQPDPVFAERESLLVGTLITIVNERMSAKAMREAARTGLEVWAYKLSPELRERLGFPRDDEEST